MKIGQTLAVSAAATVLAGLVGGVTAAAMIGGGAPEREPQEVTIVNATSTPDQLRLSPNAESLPLPDAESAPAPLATTSSAEPSESPAGPPEYPAEPDEPIATINCDKLADWQREINGCPPASPSPSQG